jgi:uncharacterized protein
MDWFWGHIGYRRKFCFWALNHSRLELTLSVVWLIFFIVGGMLLQSLFNIGSFILVFRAGLGKKVSSVFVPIGRMALTNYLVQTLFYLFFFCHWPPGFHLYGNIDIAPTYLLASAFFALHIVFSRCWLKKHAQGPVEYVWRKLSYKTVMMVRFKQSETA